MPRGLVHAILAPPSTAHHWPLPAAERQWSKAELWSQVLAPTSPPATAAAILSKKSRAQLWSSFVDLQPGWTGEGPDDVPVEEGRELQLPMVKNTEWLGQVEDSKYLDRTDLGTESWIGTPEKLDRNHILKPGEHPECEHSMTGKVEKPNGKVVTYPWWHPEFSFKVPVHAVRVTLTELWPKRRERWNVVFAGQPGGLYNITHNHVPVGGEKPLFAPFCPPLNSNTKLELRIMEADSGEFDEKLTFMPSAAASAARLKWLQRGSKPRLPMTPRPATGTAEGEGTEDGPVKFRDPDALIEEGHEDAFTGQVNYMSIPPLLAITSLAGFL